MTIAELIRDIQYILAPAVMISSSALLLLGFQNKFSNLASRFRALNHERQALSQKPSRAKEEDARLTSLNGQVDYLYGRARLVRYAITLTYGGIFFFTGTSILILLGLRAKWPHALIILSFAAGLCLVLTAAALMIAETELFFRVLRLEKKSWRG